MRRLAQKNLHSIRVDRADVGRDRKLAPRWIQASNQGQMHGHIRADRGSSIQE